MDEDGDTYEAPPCERPAVKAPTRQVEENVYLGRTSAPEPSRQTPPPRPTKNLTLGKAAKLWHHLEGTYIDPDTKKPPQINREEKPGKKPVCRQTATPRPGPAHSHAPSPAHTASLEDDVYLDPNEGQEGGADEVYFEPNAAPPPVVGMRKAPPSRGSSFEAPPPRGGLREAPPLRTWPRGVLKLRGGPREAPPPIGGPREAPPSRGGPREAPPPMAVLREALPLRAGPRGALSPMGGPHEAPPPRGGPRGAPPPRSGPSQAPPPKGGPSQAPPPMGGPHEALPPKSGPRGAPPPRSGPSQAPPPKGGPSQTPPPMGGPHEALSPRSGPSQAPPPWGLKKSAPSAAVDAQLQSEEWFAGSCDRKTAEVVLSKVNKDGAFLVRYSSAQNARQPYTLMVLFSQKVYNIPIRYLEHLELTQGYALGKEGKKSEEVFPSLQEIISHHKNKPLQLIDSKSQAKHTTFLTHPART